MVEKAILAVKTPYRMHSSLDTTSKICNLTHARGSWVKKSQVNLYNDVLQMGAGTV